MGWATLSSPPRHTAAPTGLVAHAAVSVAAGTEHELPTVPAALRTEYLSASLAIPAFSGVSTYWAIRHGRLRRQERDDGDWAFHFVADRGYGAPGAPVQDYRNGQEIITVNAKFEFRCFGMSVRAACASITIKTF